MPIFQDNREFIGRLSWLRIVVVLTFALLAAKLWLVAVLNYDHYRNLAERNRVRTVPLLAPRGLIYDRQGRVLVDNVYGFNLLLFGDEIEDSEKTLTFLAEGLGLEKRVVKERLQAAASYGLYQPAVIKEGLSMAEAAYVLARQSDHPELEILKQPRRIFRYGQLAAHVLGYGGEVSLQQLEQPEFARHNPGDIVGHSGLERTRNAGLTGRDGWRRVMVDSRGKVLQNLQRVDPVLGEELTLTLDLDLQAVAEAQLGDRPGAVVAFDARTGEILVMASRPTFEPNQFATRISPTQWTRLMEDPDDPMQNRTVQSTFSPGSIFKVVMALVGLEHGVVDADSSVYCNGGVSLYGHRFRCWRAGGHGRVSLHEAIRQSCNVYFYLLGQKLSLQQITEFSHRLGLGSTTGIELLGEVAGLVPSEEWKLRVRGERWYAGETISLAIGQGPLLVTPLQLARAVGAVATGSIPRLHLVKDEWSRQQGQELATSLEGLSPDNLALIRDAMWSVVNEGGTGRAARVVDFEVCGKTGTAQTISSSARQLLSEESAQKFEPNAWFVGFAPRDNPQIVVAVIVQRGGSGGSAAAPIAREVLRVYHEKYHKPSLSPLKVVERQNPAERL